MNIQGSKILFKQFQRTLIYFMFSLSLSKSLKAKKKKMAFTWEQPFEKQTKIAGFKINEISHYKFTFLRYQTALCRISYCLDQAFIIMCAGALMITNIYKILITYAQMESTASKIYCFLPY